MVKNNIDTFSEIAKIFDTYLRIYKDKNFQEIIEFCHDEPHSISNIQRKIKLNYKTVWTKVRHLQNAHLVIVYSIKGEKHSSSYVQSVVKLSEILNFVKDISEDFHTIIEKNKYLQERRAEHKKKNLYENFQLMRMEPLK